jgi:Zn finger protein HypA/HybF involved in hydrogenase expression
MHESLLAEEIAARVRGHARSSPSDVLRIVVRGGQDPSTVAAALRLHLEIAIPELDDARLLIVHEATDRLCSRCGSPFPAPRMADLLATCPSCGGAPLPIRAVGEVDIQWLTSGTAG